MVLLATPVCMLPCTLYCAAQLSAPAATPLPPDDSSSSSSSSSEDSRVI
jgi:hypothetical protein